MSSRASSWREPLARLVPIDRASPSLLPGRRGSLRLRRIPLCGIAASRPVPPGRNDSGKAMLWRASPLRRAGASRSPSGCHRIAIGDESMPRTVVGCSLPECNEPASYKIAAPWSDGSFSELKTFGHACADHLGPRLPRLRDPPQANTCPPRARPIEEIGIYRFEQGRPRSPVAEACGGWRRITGREDRPSFNVQIGDIARGVSPTQTWSGSAVESPRDSIDARYPIADVGPRLMYGHR